MTTTELIMTALKKAEKTLKVTLVTLECKYSVEIDTEYMMLKIFYDDPETTDDYQTLLIETNSRMDKDKYGWAMILLRLEAKLNTIKKQPKVY